MPMTEEELRAFTGQVAGNTGAAAGGAAGGAAQPSPAYGAADADGLTSAGGGDALGGAAKGAAAGSVAGPWGAVIGAAAGLLTTVMQQKAAAKAAKLKYATDQQEAAQSRLSQNQQRQITTAGEIGSREQNAYQQLLGVLARSVR